MNSVVGNSPFNSALIELDNCNNLCCEKKTISVVSARGLENRQFSSLSEFEFFMGKFYSLRVFEEFEYFYKVIKL